MAGQITAALSGFMLGVNFRSSPAAENTICLAWASMISIGIPEMPENAGQLGLAHRLGE